jgi:hypothetical protein
MARRQLQPQELAFIKEYLSNDGNSARAALAVGYPTSSWGPRLVRKASVRRVIEEELEKRRLRLQATPENILKRLSAVAFCDPRDYFPANDEALDLRTLNEDQAAAIQDADNRAGFLDDPYDIFGDPRRIVVEHRSGWFSHSCDIVLISIMDYLLDRRHVGGIRRADTYLVLGFRLQNIGDEQGAEFPALVEAAGEIIGPDAVERDLVCPVPPTPIQSHVEQRLPRSTASLVCLNEQGVDIGGTMAGLFEFSVDKTKCSAFGFGDESSTGFWMLPGNGQEWPDGFFRSNLPPLWSKRLY